MLGYRYVALRPLTVHSPADDGGLVEHVLEPGDVVPDTVRWRDPQLWVDAGWIAPWIPPKGPGRPPTHIELDLPDLSTPGAPDGQAQAATVPARDGNEVPAGERRDWEDLTGDPAPDGHPAFEGEPGEQPTVEAAAP